MQSHALLPLFALLHIPPQLTQKKSTMQFKSLDAALTAPNRDTGERQTLTYRCADLDRMVPTLMGVSKVGHKRAGVGGCYSPPGAS